MSPWWNRKPSPRPDPTQVDQIVDILSALEYGKEKQDTEPIDTALGKCGIERRATKNEVAPIIARKLGFEPFFLAVVDEVKPFAQMVAEVYTFLRRRATVGRRASTFRVTTAGAEAVFDSSLAAFPKQLVKLIATGAVEQATMALVLPAGDQSGGDGLWSPVLRDSPSATQDDCSSTNAGNRGYFVPRRGFGVRRQWYECAKRSIGLPKLGGIDSLCRRGRAGF